MPRAASIRRFATPARHTQRQVGLFLQKAKLNGNKTETNSPSRMRRAPHRSPRGLRFSVPLALSHGGPDRGFPVTTARQTQAQNKGPNFVPIIHRSQTRLSAGALSSTSPNVGRATYPSIAGDPSSLLSTCLQWFHLLLSQMGPRYPP